MRVCGHPCHTLRSQTSCGVLQDDLLRLLAGVKLHSLRWRRLTKHDVSLQCAPLATPASDSCVPPFFGFFGSM